MRKRDSELKHPPDSQYWRKRLTPSEDAQARALWNEARKISRIGKPRGRRQEVINMLFSVVKVLGGVILTGVGVVAAAMGAGVTGDGIAETFNGGSVGLSESSSTLRKAS